MTAVPPRPAAPLPESMRAAPGFDTGPDEYPAAPDATAGDGLREAIAEALWRDDTGGDVPLSTRKPGTQRTYARIADTLLAGPLRDVLAAAARDAEKVRRVEAVLDELELDVPAMVHIRRALDPS